MLKIASVLPMIIKKGTMDVRGSGKMTRGEIENRGLTCERHSEFMVQTRLIIVFA